MATNRSVSRVGHGLEPGVRRRRQRSRAFAGRQPRRVLGAHGDDRSRAVTTRATRGASTTTPIATARARNSCQRRRELQPGGRLHATHRLHPIVRGCSVSVRGPGRLQSVRKFTWTGIGRVHRERRGLGRCARLDRALRHGVREQRPALDRRHARLRMLRSPSRRRVSGADRAGRLHLQRRDGVIHVRRATARVSGTIAVRAGEYYDGTIRSVTVGPGASRRGACRYSTATVGGANVLDHAHRAAGRERSPRGWRARASTTRFSPLMFASGSAAVQLRRPRR